MRNLLSVRQVPDRESNRLPPERKGDVVAPARTENVFVLVAKSTIFRATAFP
jgi:hypothetical protein